jgi:hypothetical protein
MCPEMRSKKTKHGGRDITVNYMKHLKEPNIVNYIKVKRLAWAGHLVRMNNDRTLKKNVQQQNRWSKKSWKTKIAMGRWC